MENYILMIHLLRGFSLMAGNNLIITYLHERSRVMRRAREILSCVESCPY
jgi:heme/copper-type cytochrome/quinol oxidase subunit 1